MITYNEFSILETLHRTSVNSQRELAAKSGVTLSTVNKTLAALRGSGLVDRFTLTDSGLKALEPYRVRNAVIMAAGVSSRFVPFSYEKPKGLFVVRGEVLIERQIRQLREAGIQDIIVVVGYMKEKFFYLEDKYHVKIVVNEEYLTRNNNSTLYLVRESLGNTYICSSDNYFTENVFRSYNYRAFYSAVWVDGETDEYCIKVGRNRRIEDVVVGGRDSWIMMGHAYFSDAFSQKFKKILEQEYNNVGVDKMLWEDIYIRHIRELPMYIQKYDRNVVLEFDSLDDLSKFDGNFISNTDSKIFSNICSVLNCLPTDIKHITPVKKGLTNLSFSFECLGRKYLYRHPGAGTEEIINRHSEAFSQKAAFALGLDSTFIYMNEDEGWKISRFIENAHELDYHDENEVRQALSLIRRLHESGVISPADFDIRAETEKLISMVGRREQDFFEDFDDLWKLIGRLFEYTRADNFPKTLCHNDCYSPNFLVADGAMHLIDWEYSGNSDPASDLGTFICCSDYDLKEAMKVLRMYFGRMPTDRETSHYIAYIAICAFYWFIWALYKESVGTPVGKYLYIWYKYAKEFGKTAVGLYQGTCGPETLSAVSAAPADI